MPQGIDRDWSRLTSGDWLLRGDEDRRLRAARLLAIALWVAASSLTIKADWDLVHYRTKFPGWFVPVFVLLTGVLVAWSGFVCWRIQRQDSPAIRPEGRRVSLICLALGVSFVCTCSMHAFYPFRPPPLDFILVLSHNPVWAANFVLPLFGAAFALALWWLLRLGKPGTALVGLTLLGLLLLVPNDQCRNPFNTWWLRTIGASPLMFVPNMFAALLAMAALMDVHRRLSTTLLLVVCVLTLLLGVGHMTRLVW